MYQETVVEREEWSLSSSPKQLSGTVRGARASNLLYVSVGKRKNFIGKRRLPLGIVGRIKWDSFQRTADLKQPDLWGREKGERNWYTVKVQG